MRFFRGLIIGLAISAIFWVLVGLAIARATTSSQSDTLRYKEIGGDGPTLIIKGHGLGSAEDVTTLRLVEYRGAGRPITYRVVRP